MGLPQINIIFSTQARETSKVSDRGLLAVILKDSGVETGSFTVVSSDDIPETLTAENQAYLNTILIGGETAPRKLYCYALASDAESFDDALSYFSTINFDYVVCPPDVTAEQAKTVLTWVGTQREDYHRRYKCVLPETAADRIYSVNVCGSINGGTPGALCGRIAGLICGTPLTRSITYAVLEEAESCPDMSNPDLDAAVDAGKLVVFNDGEKIKVAREVNSFVTLDDVHNTDQWKSIKVVETMDLIQDDLRRLYADYYVGKYDNRLDHKMLLVAATLSYFEELAKNGIIGDTFSCDLDLDATRDYLKSQGKDVSEMTDTEVKSADTGTHVFLKGAVQIFGAIEDITLSLEV